MTDLLQDYESWAGSFLEKMEPSARRKLAMDIGRDLRRSQIARIKSQKNPDGSAYEPRRPRPGRALRSKSGRIKRRRTMFDTMASTRFLMVRSTQDGVAVGFYGRTARIARIHQEGGVDQVGLGVYRQYPRRVLLGFSAGDIDMIQDRLLQHIGG